MTPRHPQVSETTRQQAVDELQQLILATYPDTVFEVGSGGDNPDGTYITAIVNSDDPDEVMDLVIDRLLQLQIDELLPVYVIPVRTPERVAQMRRRAGLHPITSPDTTLHP